MEYAFSLCASIHRRRRDFLCRFPIHELHRRAWPRWFFATLFFSGGPGIPNLGSFSIDLGSFGWTPDATFQAYANPEPGTFWLQHLTTQHHRERRGLNAQLRNLRFARAAAVLRAIRPKPRASACFSKTASRTRPAVVPSDLSSISPKARVASN